MDATNQSSGTATITGYLPKRVELQTVSVAPAMLLLNDRYDPKWKVRVDGQIQPLLRCNFIMRGVHLTAGEHRIVFSFEPPQRNLYVSLAAVLLGLALCGFLAVSRK